MPGVLALGASLDLLASLAADFGRAAIARRVLAVTDEACRRLEAVGAKIASDRTAAHASGIVSFHLAGVESEAVRRQALADGVALSCRAGRLRISPHAYNNGEDLTRLAAAVAGASKSTP
jgi:selenocysteine lyase/cysteine desulfurase